MHQLKADAIDMKQALLRGNIHEVADVLNRSWDAKRRTSELVSNSIVQGVFELGLKNGAVAGKVSGAGGGGFLMFMTDPEQRYRLIAGLNAGGMAASSVQFTDAAFLLAVRERVLVTSPTRSQSPSWIWGRG
jgi:D-glycero-alpha-D-manno-heptose-7-phosphate kinase